MGVAMLLRNYWDRQDAAQRVGEAVRRTLAEGDHTVDIYVQGAISTAEFTSHICKNL